VQFICDSINEYLENTDEKSDTGEKNFKYALGKRLVDAFDSDTGSHALFWNVFQRKYGDIYNGKPWNNGNKITKASPEGGSNYLHYDFKIQQSNKEGLHLTTKNGDDWFTVEEKSCAEQKAYLNFDPRFPWRLAVQLTQFSLRGLAIGKEYAELFPPLVEKFAMEELDGSDWITDSQDFQNAYKKYAFFRQGINDKAPEMMRELKKRLKAWEKETKNSFAAFYKDEIHEINDALVKKIDAGNIEVDDLVKRMDEKLKESNKQKDYWIQVAGLVPSETSKKKYVEAKQNPVPGVDASKLKELFNFDDSSENCFFTWSTNDIVKWPKPDAVEFEAVKNEEKTSFGPQLYVTWGENGKQVGKRTSLRFRNAGPSNFGTDFR